jgi:hypothetical protein
MRGLAILQGGCVLVRVFAYPRAIHMPAYGRIPPTVFPLQTEHG